MSDIPPCRCSILGNESPEVCNALFHENQIRAAENIVRAFTSGHSRKAYALLKALCQSGKSGTFHYVARIMLERGFVDHVNVVCGMNEVCLRFQAEKDAMKFNRDAMESGRMTICFRNSFPKSILQVERTLWILDESHTDQNVGQSVDKFFQKHDLHLEGTTQKMLENETYILSVSATPYSEESDIKHGKSLPKHLETLHPGRHYWGIEQYWYKGYVYSTFDISREWEQFKNLVLAKGNRYCIVRLHSSKEESSLRSLETNAPLAGIKILYCTSNKSETQIAVTREEKYKNELDYCMEDVPTQPTIIIVKGRLRAGKVVPKQHVGFVWEDSKNPLTDTIVQSLLGRMCGYIALQAHKPDIYLPSVLIEETKKIIKASPIERTIQDDLMLPLRGRNLLSVRLPNTADYYTHPTIPVFMSRDELRSECGDWDSLTVRQQAEVAWRLLTSSRYWTEKVQSVPWYTAAQKRELEDMKLTIDRPAYRNVARDTGEQAQLLRNIKECAQSHICPSIYLSNMKDRPHGFVAIIRAEAGWSLVEDIGHIWFYIALKNKNFVSELPLNIRFPPTTGKEVFRTRLTLEVQQETVAGMMFGLKSCALRNPTIFKNQMDWFIRSWREGEDDENIPMGNPCIKSHNNKLMRFCEKTISVHILKEILKSLESTYSVCFANLPPISLNNSILVSEFKWVGI